MKNDELTSKPFEQVINNGPYPIRFPKMSQLEQDQEWCEVLIDGNWTKVRFHDYTDVYKVPGLYETLFYRTLMCNSPNRVTNLLGEVLVEQNQKPEDLRVLDFGAGNGMEGEALQGLGIRNIVGVDIIQAAQDAAMRDRSWVYDKYLVADLTNLSKEEKTFLTDYKFNALTVVAALGFGDIPPLAFYNAYDLIANGGYVAFNIRSEFLKTGHKSKFSKLIQHMLNEEIIEIELYKRYQHRLNIAGEPIYYVAIIAKKLKELKVEDVEGHLLMNAKKPIVFFDGECGLCDSFISFLFKHDKDQYFLAAPLQGESAKHYLSKDSLGKLSTVILFDDGKEYVKSDAVLKIFKRLGFPWSIVSLFTFIPKKIRDMIYDLVAINRHRFFSKSSCRLPTQSEKERILN